jgi:hypothetical protein
MANRKGNGPGHHAASPGPGLAEGIPKRGFIESIRVRTNRGMLLDLVVFLLNLFFMRILTRQFMNIVHQAGDGKVGAGILVFLFFLGMFLLPTIGAILKRGHLHQRVSSGSDDDDFLVMGCLCNPIFYFTLNILIWCLLNAFALQFFYGDDEPGGVMGASILFGIVFTIFQTYIVYRCFGAPKVKASTGFLNSPFAETMADGCIFLNMILFQIAWNIATSYSLPRVSGVVEFAGRLFILFFAALIIYFPPRVFYLSEDGHRPRTWLTILLANTPAVVRLVIGTSR